MSVLVSVLGGLILNRSLQPLLLFVFSGIKEYEVWSLSVSFLNTLYQILLQVEGVVNMKLKEGFEPLSSRQDKGTQPLKKSSHVWLCVVL